MGDNPISVGGELTELAQSSNENQLETPDEGSPGAGVTETIVEHVGTISQSLSFIEPLERKLERLLQQPRLEWREQLEELGSSLTEEAARLRQLRESLSERVNLNIGETGEASETEVRTKRTCTSTLGLVPWIQLRNPASIPDVHCAIEIPTNQPSRDDLMDPEEFDEPIEPREVSDLAKEYIPGKELPERIRITSVLLASFLDFGLHDGSLSRSSDGPLSILRPFKLLVYYNAGIREALERSQKQRYSQQPATEEEYDQQWKSTLPDEYRESWSSVKFDQMEVTELTALIKDLRSLITFMDTCTRPFLASSPQDNVFFSDLWNVFPAGSLIYIRDKKTPQKIWKVLQRAGGRRYNRSPNGAMDQRDDWCLKSTQFVIDCFHLDFDGVRYVPTFHQISIDPFEGSQEISSLPVLPLEVAEMAKLVDRVAMVDRGKEFLKCTKPSHRDYLGRNQLLKPNGTKIAESDADIPDSASRYSEWIESEVMVDFERALFEIPAWRPGGSEMELYVADSSELGDGDVDQDGVWDRKISDPIINQETEKWHRWDKDHPPSKDEDLLLLPDRVFAFVFRTRRWACLQLGKGADGVEKLKVRIPREDPWNDLQLPGGHKRVVQSLIEFHANENTAKGLQFDLVKAKGKGVIILLHGVPGVGKTSTAECAAEANQKPLLPITCGDLGSTPRDVESRLQEAFQLAQAWKCVLLLDEADIFLAQRNEDNIERNALVSVFLRALEYYEGILFLTTNRVGVFDEAFKSRIHMALYYPPLEWQYAKKIWETHLRKLHSSGFVEVDHDEILSFAEEFFKKQSVKGSPIGPVWNGRQIRNAFQSAVALAGFRNQGSTIRLEREHLQRVSNVSDEFNNYLWNIKCQSDADKASRWGYRHDAYRPNHDLHLAALGVQPGSATTNNFSANPMPNLNAFTSNLSPLGSSSTSNLQYGVVQNPAPVSQMQGFTTPATFQGPAQTSPAQGQLSQQQFVQQQMQFQQPQQQMQNQQPQQHMQFLQPQQHVHFQQPQQQMQVQQPQQQLQVQQQQLQFQSSQNAHGIQPSQANLNLEAQYTFKSPPAAAAPAAN